MSRFVLLVFLLTFAFDFGSADTVALVGPQFYIPGQQVTQANNLADSFGPLTYPVGNPNIFRQKRAFDTYICGVCYAPHTSIFDFGKNTNNFFL